MQDKTTGTVKWFNNKKGYGFIVDQDGNDIFVHYKNITCKEDAFRTLNEGESVAFNVEQGDKGPQAVMVERQ